MMDLRPVPAFACALALMACGDQARVQVAFWAREPLAIDMLRVWVSDGSRAYGLGPANFHGRGGVLFYDSPDLVTATRGTLRFTYALLASSGDTVSEGTVELPLRSDWQWGIDVIPDSINPIQQCFGCAGSRNFSLAPGFRGPRVDSIFVLWGGNSIKNPVVY
jgi:hypothetical protein